MTPLPFALPRRTLSLAVAAGTVAATLTAGVVAPAHAVTATTHSAAGISADYHLYDAGVDRSRPVGAVFYFDGDGQYYAQRPDSSMLQAMARRAAARNMVLVVPVAPYDRSWTSDSEDVGNWFRSLAARVLETRGIDPRRIHLAGYSGGAEFISTEVLSDRAGWIRGGGATLIGGGGVYDGRLETAPDAALRATDPTWYVGSEDSYGATQPATWSALVAAGWGVSAYQRAGFGRADRVVIPGFDHGDYDLADLVGDDLDRIHLGVAPAENAEVNGFPLHGAIGAKWSSLGGIGWAVPVSAEYGSGYDSVYQRFVGTDGREKALYWSPRTGTHVVDYGGSIGRKFAADGYAGTYGPPTMSEARIAGGAYQVFDAAGRRTKMIWSPGTGSHAVKEYGAIGRKWAALGYERGLGYPTTDEYPTATGVTQGFTRGRVQWNSSTGAVTVTRF